MSRGKKIIMSKIDIKKKRIIKWLLHTYNFHNIKSYTLSHIYIDTREINKPNPLLPS